MTKVNIGAAFTCNVMQEKRAPRRIELLGDKTKRPEPAQHVIEFPGGAIELSRTSDGCYWAHILVNQEWADPDMDGIKGAFGAVVASRFDRRGELVALDDESDIRQIAVLIRPMPRHESAPVTVVAERAAQPASLFDALLKE